MTLELAFWLLAAAVGWCYAGYPLLVAAQARLRPRPVHPADPRWCPRVTAVIAVRNGSTMLAARVRNLLDQQYPAARLDVAIICNGSDEATLNVAQDIAREEPRVRIFVSQGDRGKAGAINMAAEVATGEVIVFADARQTFAPDAVTRLVEPFADREVGVVTGRLVVGRAETASVEGVRLYWGMEVRLRSAESRSGSVVGATGAIYAVRTVLLPVVPANLILDDVYIPMRIAMGGHRVVMAPEAVAFDVPATGQRAEFERKRRTMVGNIQLVRALPSLLSPLRNPLFARFLSHKVLRLLTPFCFVAMLGVSAALDGPLYTAFFIAELSLYVLGVIGIAFGVRGLSVPSAFVLVHAAIFAAVWRWREDASGVWTATGGHRTSDLPAPGSAQAVASPLFEPTSRVSRMSKHV